MRIPPEKVTIVFDTGNNSKASMELLDDTPYYFVGSLKPYDYKHFMEIPLEKFPLFQWKMEKKLWVRKGQLL